MAPAFLLSCALVAAGWVAYAGVIWVWPGGGRPRRSARPDRSAGRRVGGGVGADRSGRRRAGRESQRAAGGRRDLAGGRCGTRGRTDGRSAGPSPAPTPRSGRRRNWPPTGCWRWVSRRSTGGRWPRRQPTRTPSRCGCSAGSRSSSAGGTSAAGVAVPAGPHTAEDPRRPARSGRGRAELCELLWPDDEPRRTAHRLSVLLSAVRAVLDPSRRWPVDRYVRADLTGVRVDLTRVVVDAENLLTAVPRAERLARDGDPARAREVLAEVDAAYRGRLRRRALRGLGRRAAGTGPLGVVAGAARACPSVPE
ncbi:hypothetical protein NKG94_09130 [Micromonospora sp. M12]